ncbi:unnamed protein product [Prorocentrum cordatum]|uniref:N-acetylglucosamine-6-phosphate deacetylase n=1 Tax=Prorocentrum cordatum TaxID=2364126 RepID=A0ABN9VBB4_9DINO|nr:unnamed protein product [Polarella glacialis]
MADGAFPERASGAPDASPVLVIRAKRLVADGSTLLEPGVAVVQNGLLTCVASAGRGEPAEVCAAIANGAQVLETELLVPGFIDIHTHGIGGSDEIRDFWRHPEVTQSKVVRYGTTSLLATMIFPASGPSIPAKNEVCAGTNAKAKLKFCGWCAADDGCVCTVAGPRMAEDVLEIASTLKSIIGQVGHGAVLEGIHAEGPIVESLGGLPLGDAEMSLNAFQKLLDLLGPALKIMTIAPSCEARSTTPFERMELLLSRGVRPALGHDTSCSLEEIAGALRVAAAHHTVLHVTHTFNVQRFHHRECGLANVALLPRFPRLPVFEGVTPPTIELIGDGVHAALPVLQLALASKPTGTACFITDGISEPVLGKESKYADRVATVERDANGGIGVYSVGADSGKKLLVGSCIMILDAFRTAVQVLDVGLCRAVDLCCCTPAAVARLPHTGSLAPRRRADLVLLDGDLDVCKVFVAGRLAYSRRDSGAPSLSLAKLKVRAEKWRRMARVQYGLRVKQTPKNGRLKGKLSTYRAELRSVGQSPTEDDSSKVEAPLALLALFDGQSSADARAPGPHAAEWCCRHVHTKLIRNLISLPPNSVNTTFLKAILIKTFEDLDRELLVSQPGIQDGCGAALALLAGDQLLTAVVGRCSAIVVEPGEDGEAVGTGVLHNLGKNQGRCDLPGEQSWLRQHGGVVFRTQKR